MVNRKKITRAYRLYHTHALIINGAVGTYRRMLDLTDRKQKFIISRLSLYERLSLCDNHILVVYFFLNDPFYLGINKSGKHSVCAQKHSDILDGYAFIRLGFSHKYRGTHTVIRYVTSPSAGINSHLSVTFQIILLRVR